MSDGNFNTALLPHTPFASGLKTGRMQMRIRALAALQKILDRHFPTLTDEEKENITEEFKTATR
ncbi:MAG: hypothetical protein J5630_00430 [Bacteroidaceae bacterium]|nr:hypothetical protein [Bacteroidaceae bacterium]